MEVVVVVVEVVEEEEEEDEEEEEEEVEEEEEEQEEEEEEIRIPSQENDCNGEKTKMILRKIKHLRYCVIHYRVVQLTH